MADDPRLDDAQFVEIYASGGRRISLTELTELRRDHAYRFLARDNRGGVEVVTARLASTKVLPTVPHR